MPRQRPKPTATPVRKRGVKRYSDRHDELVRRCLKLMLANEWKTGQSSYELMEELNYSHEMVVKAASAASRFIRLCRGDVREEILRSLDYGKRLALEAETVVYNTELDKFAFRVKPDLGAFKAFIQMQAEIHGLTGKVSANVQRGESDKVAVPIDELRDLLDGLGYDVTKKESGEDGESSDSDDESSGDDGITEE